MAVDKSLGRYALSTPATITFLNLLEPRAVNGPNGKPSGDPKYSSDIEFALDHVDVAGAKAAAAAVAKERWPGRAFDELSFPFKSGDKLADKAKGKGKDREFSRGRIVLTARSKYQPQLSIIENGKLVDLEGDAITANGRKFYSGTDALVQVTFAAYDGVGNNPDGVNAYLDMVVSLNKGTKVMGGRTAAETFKGYAGVASAADPTQSDADDEIPF